MAVDLMILPLSQYWSGNYVTPVMKDCWDRGISYTLVTPEGPRELPPGVPMGGQDAAAEQASLEIDVVQPLLHSLPEGFTAWSEEPVDLWFRRVDTSSLAALFTAAQQQEQPNQLSSAVIFLPSEAALMFRALDIVFGSLGALRRQLESTEWPVEAEPAVTALLEAVGEAQRRVRPLVLDM